MGETASIVSSADFASVLDSITAQISVSTIVGVLGALAAAVVGIVFMWWGVRKISGAIMNAFKSGRLRI